MANNIKTGAVTGTGAAINIPTGFDVDYVRVWNVTDGTTVWEWFDGMTAGHALQNTNNASTQNSRITANGISRFAGDAATAKGFTIGSVVSVNTKDLRYFAAQNSE